jgi:diguanylate cyclase (GGDEF)-like protein/PAS domain S-box-containing protein
VELSKNTSQVSTKLRRIAGTKWARFLALAMFLTLLYYLPVFSPIAHAAVYTLIGAASLAAIGYSLLYRHSVRAQTWGWLGAGLLLYFIGDLIFNYYRFALGAARPFPSVADAFFLLARVPLIVGLLNLARRLQTRRSAFTLIDTFIVTSGLALLWWVFLMAPEAYNPNFSPLERIISVAYPLTDFLLLACAIRLGLASSRRTAGAVMIGASLAGLLAADVIYSILQLNNVFTIGTWIDLGWIMFYALLGAAALYPDTEKLETPKPPVTQARLNARLVLLSFAALLFPLTLAISHIFHIREGDPPTIIIGTVLILLVMLRIQRLMRENLNLQEEVARWKSDLLFRSIVQRAYSGVGVFAEDKTPSYISPAMLRLANLEADTKFSDIVHPADQEKFNQFWNHTLHDSEPAQIEYRLRKPDGSWADVTSMTNNLLHDEWIHGVVMITQDITARKKHERELLHLAYTDSLTGLPNRTALAGQLEEAVDHARANERLTAIFFFDLDDFKSLNDSLGHSFGDQVLMELARRFKSALRDDDTVARFGGDEFIVIARNLTQPADANLVYQRLNTALTRPFKLEAYSIHLEACAGVALTGPGEPTPEELVRNADLALYRAKADGPGSMRIYSEQLHTASLRRLKLANALQDILSDPGSAQPELYFQPVFRLSGSVLAGAEASARWHHPEFGLIDPSELTQLAGETNLLTELEARTLNLVCRQLADWSHLLRDGKFFASLSVSHHSFAKSDFAATVSDSLRRHHLPAKHLVLEITETALVQNQPLTTNTLQELAVANVRVEIANFGREYSSFSQLLRLPHAGLKIDRTFIQTVQDTGNTALIRHIVTLAHELGRTVTADGIETSSQAAWLEQLECDYGQGYWFSRPVPASQLEQFLLKPAVS